MRKGQTKPGGYNRSGLELAEPTSIRLTQTDRKYIESTHGSLTAAIRLLTKGGKYEQMVERCEMLTNRLRNLGLPEVEPITLSNVNYNKQKNKLKEIQG